MPAVMPATKAKMTREKANGINGSFEGHMYRKASDVLGRVHRYACILRRGSCSALQCFDRLDLELNRCAQIQS